MDHITPEQRSAVMRKVRGKDTTPEWKVRRLIHGMGYRYRLHGGGASGLPGKPDLIFAGRKKAIFVHGCFWHMHEGCPRNRIPEARREEYWLPKLTRNVERDRENARKIAEMGWTMLVIWECETAKAGLDQLRDRIAEFLGQPRTRRNNSLSSLTTSGR